MKKFLVKVGIAVASCLFFTVIVPILLTSAQNSLFAFGFGIMFLFFALCFYLVMTSKFFNNEKTEKQVLTSDKSPENVTEPLPH